MTTKIDLQKPLIVCLCGSGRFKEAFDEAEFNETLEGRIVLTIGCNTKDIARDADWEHVKPMLDELHRRKIDLADEILVLNVGGYIGDSTRGEILYAEGLGKCIRYLEPLGSKVLKDKAQTQNDEFPTTLYVTIQEPSHSEKWFQSSETCDAEDGEIVGVYKLHGLKVLSVAKELK